MFTGLVEKFLLLLVQSKSDVTQTH